MNFRPPLQNSSSNLRNTLARKTSGIWPGCVLCEDAAVRSNGIKTLFPDAPLEYRAVNPLQLLSTLNLIVSFHDGIKKEYRRLETKTKAGNKDKELIKISCARIERAFNNFSTFPLPFG